MTVSESVRIRDAGPTEATTLEALQRRSSDIWDQYHEQLAAHPDAIELPQAFIDNGWVRVAVTADGVAVGFSAVIPSDTGTHELDGLFVEPSKMRHGVGRALIEDAASRARAAGAIRLEVTVGPAQPFYERVGFTVTGTTQTRFGPAVRMRRELHKPLRSRATRSTTHMTAQERSRRPGARERLDNDAPGVRMRAREQRRASEARNSKSSPTLGQRTRIS